jgi:Ca2+-binding EF-hand superfamily protein
MSSRRTLLGMLALLAAADAASAKPLTFDLDGNGRVDRREFVKGREARFHALDHNGDHVVSAADFSPESQSRPLIALMGRMIGAADLNRDGKVTLSELQLSGSPVFEAADLNMNGELDSGELKNLMARFPGRP